MSKYRKHLPRLGNALSLTDGGLETTLVFHEGLELPCFAAYIACAARSCSAAHFPMVLPDPLQACVCSRQKR
jgi:hypothetical protein